ncbi:3-oxoadipate enol-lactonase [Agrobacterium rhizogenes]|nr:3-oxoadipate enol-lactonase [Rhizobium rhizogenes]NTG58115.1 3-oxoadipate enol-lactonase [Rhizobium rhizogenes]NTH03753.1 3-oxoadipate enol-lactonase [Rhizobium rhizogenes]NTI59461.1 3-oxoadipate enol-lactonase [Rhizobium rhizogenes]
MPFITVNNIQLHYRLSGRRNGPRIAFANSLGSDLRIWGEVEQRLGQDFEMLFFDQRGHGLSEVTDQPYTISQLAADLLGLLNIIGWTQVSLCGVSVGGMIAMEAAAQGPDHVTRLVLLDTATKIGTAAGWNDRISAIETSGIPIVSEQILTRWFPSEYRMREPRAWEAWRRMLESTADRGYINTCLALRDADLTAAAGRLAVPTLVMAGSNDQSTPPELVAATAGQIAGSRFENIPGAGHLPCIDAPDVLAGAIEAFCQIRETIRSPAIAHS